MEPTPDTAREVQLIIRWRRRPDLFVEEAIGATPTNQQREFLALLGKFAYARIKASLGLAMSEEEKHMAGCLGISIRSGHGTGKDAVLSWTYLWLLFCWPEPLGRVTGPTGDQLDKVLWPEIRRWIRRSKIELWRWIEVQSDKVFLKEGKGEWFVSPKTANMKADEESQGETLAGPHADNLILAVDEASGVPPGVFKPLEGAMTGKMNFAILIGNMTRSTGYFYDSHFGKDCATLWIRLHWDCEQSDMDEITGTKAMANYVARMERKYGRDSNMFRIRVKGDPPISDPDALIPLEWVLAAVGREVEADPYDPVLTGVDCGAGGDASAICHRNGPVVSPFIRYNTKDTMELTGHVALEVDGEESDAVMVDVIGIGNGVAYRLRELGYRVFPVNVAEHAPRSERFVRLRDELCWRVRQRFEDGTISIPNDPDLIGECASIKYHPESSGKVKVESKKEMKARGLESPNSFDALMLTFFLPETVFARKKHKDRYGDDDDDEGGSDKESWMAT